MELDKTDLAILRVLDGNARLSFRKVAAKTGVSVATVMNRVRELENNKVIKAYSVELDYENMGYELQAITSIIVSKGKLNQVENKIAVHPNVTAVYDITGHFDVLVISRFKTRRGLDEFLKKIESQKEKAGVRVRNKVGAEFDVCREK